MTPTPSPSPSTSPAPVECDFWDVSCKVGQGINDWLRDLAGSAIKTIFDTLGTSLLQTPQVDEMPRVVDIWSQTVVVANTGFVVLVMAGGLVLMGHETLQTSYTVKDIAPRLVIGAISANISRELVGKAIELANALALALLGPGINAATAVDTIQKRLTQNLDIGAIFVVLIILVAVVLAAVLAVIYVVRLTLTTLLVAAAPIALACHALPQTEGLARLWWRALTGVLAIQVCQALVFVVAIRVILTPDGGGTFDDRSQLFDLLIVVCLLYILVRIPSWITAQIWQGGGRPGVIQRIARIAIYRSVIRSATTSRRRP